MEYPTPDIYLAVFDMGGKGLVLNQFKSTTFTTGCIAEFELASLTPASEL